MTTSALAAFTRTVLFHRCSSSGLQFNPILRASSAFFATAANSAPKPNVNVGTIGHIDHGKTTLTSAITRVQAKKGFSKHVKFDEIDKGKEEKKRGITINIAHIGYESNLRRYSHTDCPGHSDFIKNMICGTSQMDVAVLVIAATDGVMEQTKEHLILAKQVGVKHMVVFINKADLVEDDVLDLVEIEARELLSLHGFDGDNTPVIRGSALGALEGSNTECIDNLLNALDSLPQPDRNEKEAFVMPIGSKTAITGRGTVIVGTLERGILKKGDKVEIKGDGQVLQTTASDIQVFGKSVKEVRAGDHCGVLCRGIKADMVKRGMWAGHPGGVTITNHLMVELYLLSEAENGRKIGIRTGFTDKMYCSTWDQVGRFDMKNELLMPGEHTSAHVILMKEMPLRIGMPFTLREGSSKSTIARGIISELKSSVAIENNNLKKMSTKVDEELDNFLWGRTDVKDYLKMVAECDRSVAESLNRKVAGLHETLDKQLRKGVETNLPRLLEQVPALQSLEDTLHSVQMRMSSVAAESNRLSTICGELSTMLREQTKQMESTMIRRNMAADTQRCEELFESLEKRSDLVKKAEITAEIKEILKDNENLRKIGWLKSLIDTKLSVAENEVRRNGAEELKRGLSSLNSSLVASSQRALSTLNLLDSELDVLLSSSIVELDKKLMELSGAPEIVNKSLPVVAALIQTHLEQAAMLGDGYRKKFSEKLARLVRSRVPLDTPYALRFVQHLGRVFNAKGDCAPVLNDSLRPLKNALLTHSLARLHQIVEEHDFSTAHANAFVDLINSAMEEELKKVDWDAELSQKMHTNIQKCIEMIAKKLEANLHLQRDDLLLGDRLTANQMTNYRLIQTADGIVKRWPQESKSVQNVQKSALDEILNEVKVSVRAIMSRMHIEKRGAKSISPYMQELLTYATHIDMHMAHVSRAVCHSHVLSQIAEYVIESFVLNASLVRTFGTDERHLIVIDFSRLLEAVRSMEWPSKYGDTSRFLDLFSDDIDMMCKVEGIRKSIFVHLLISDSPSDLMSPHDSVDWTIEEYTKWYEEHTEQEIIALLNGLISSYNSLVISKGQQQYVEHYPRILKLLAESF
ncbi:unnamed protein product [Caenorhabditis bovis]|uniref:protein-synthesizing GTPase n=1 Tax=Caenorhabditis bovis TaxID=2654633 RepID=A0A8S1F5G5_9PELO|nr:unnamed protein product [Caenorhabditis bovis]